MMEAKRDQEAVFEISREELYELVWATPINHLAEKFQVSGSYLARVCGALNVPRPPVGYWQKKAVGKDKPRPDLPPARPGDQLVWSKDTPLATPIERPARTRRKGTTMPKTTGPQRHPILRGVEAHFRKSRRIDEGEFLRPYKYLLPDIVSSEACLMRALDLANDLYNALEKKGHRVLIAPPGQGTHRAHVEEREVIGKDRKYGRYSTGSIWSPQRPTVTYIGSVPIGLALTEMTERATMRYVKGKYVRADSVEARSAKPWQLVHSWTTERDLPCGRFRLVAYSPHYGVEWVMNWQEIGKRSLEGIIPEIIRSLEGAEKELQTLKDAADEAAAKREREWQEAQERSRREQDRRQVAQALTDSRKQLAEIMEKWATAKSVERFFTEAEACLLDLEDERRERLQGRLALARSMLGTLDPLEFLEGWIAPGERYTTKYPME